MAKTARDVMTSGAECAQEDQSVAEVAKRLAELDVGAMPICGSDNRLKGMITDRDIVVRLIAQGKDTQNARVNEAMTKSVRKVDENAPINEVVELMSNAQIRRVPVVNAKDQIVGIVSLADLATGRTQADKVGKTVEQISEGPGNN